MPWFIDYFEAWNSHDGERVASFMTPTATYSDIALGESHTGHAEIAAWVNSMTPGLSSDFRFECTYSVLTDTGYVLEWVMSGTHDGSTPQLRASGKPFAIHGVSVGELEEGKIKRNTDYWNSPELLVHIGAMPAPGAA
jgi:steroid delta-isomerase-like uncharacterized protein